MTPETPIGVRIVVRRRGQLEWTGVVDRQTILIGRSPRSDVVLSDELVSWTHAVVRVDQRVGLTVTDRSSNGSYYREQRVSEAEIGAGGILSIPPFELDLTLQGWVQETPYVETVAPRIEPPAPVPEVGTGGPKTTPAAVPAALRVVDGPGPLRGKRFVLSDGPNTVGRAPDCQVCLDLRTVSRYHARLTPTSGGRWRVQDAGSQNGIEVNGRLTQDLEVNAGDRITFGTEVVTILEAAAAAPEPNRAGTIGDSLIITPGPSSFDPRVTVVRVAGRVDGYTADYLREQVFQCIDRGEVRLVIDFLKCAYCDHAGLAVLVNAHVVLRQKKGAICLTGLNAQLRDAFVLLRLDQVLAVAPREGDAVARVAPR